MQPTQKTINAYYQAKREWISANDNYNKANFGITEAQYKVFKEIDSHLFGMMGGMEYMTVKEVKQALLDLNLAI